jgi:hypothetical protein
MRNVLWERRTKCKLMLFRRTAEVIRFNSGTSQYLCDINLYIINVGY